MTIDRVVIVLERVRDNDASRFEETLKALADQIAGTTGQTACHIVSLSIIDTSAEPKATCRCGEV